MCNNNLPSLCINILIIYGLLGQDVLSMSCDLFLKKQYFGVEYFMLVKLVI